PRRNLQDDCANMHVSCNSDNTVSVAKPCVSRLCGLFRADYRGPWTRRAAPCGWAGLVVDWQVAEPPSRRMAMPSAAIQLVVAGFQARPGLVSGICQLIAVACF
ncbi:hypothetical protein, partial [Ralstonia solanacearum]|uniref:hypothetical protein n=1 Tax=Ralstonia solanacearum TaxID=305 RepID=UPI001E473D31